ncbi:ComF family protein [Candidatus Methylacidithermus pantelleriae]|uniref:ComF family protein n=1 Tax=Candidatus Methylacidithermus pantelleriae TaxID=2744239 RepID=UPI00157BBADD|nr:ComF family protein [Candidatus Methylacidithermus pantelleriae]
MEKWEKRLAWFRRHTEELGALFFPTVRVAHPLALQSPLCPSCGKEGVKNPRVCPNCQQHGPWAFLWARAPYRAQGVVWEAIHRLSHRGESFWLPRLADWLEEGFRLFAAFFPWDALVPVPLHPVRRRELGFNPCLELARMLGMRQRIPVLNCLYTVRAGSSQKTLTAPERAMDHDCAFRVKRGFDLQAQSLLIITDVLVTGLTAQGCARALQQGGAERIAVLAVGRAE